MAKDKTLHILNSLPNIITVTDGVHLLQANKLFLEFFDYDSVEDFKRDYDCICDHFLQERGKNYLEKVDVNGVAWSSKVIEHQDSIHKVLMKDANGVEHIFKVTGNVIKIDGVDIHEEVIVFEDVTGFENQAALLEEVEIPMLDVSKEIFMIPVIGLIDSVRSQRLMTNMLRHIQESSKRVALVDVAGISTIDSAVAAHLIKISKATALMGCETIISGISPEIAQTIVNLGIDIKGFKTTSTLQDALEYSYKKYTITDKES